jgi:hypothetical protein
MGHCDDILADVRDQIDASDAPLAEARARLGLVKKIATGSPVPCAPTPVGRSPTTP